MSFLTDVVARNADEGQGRGFLQQKQSNKDSLCRCFVLFFNRSDQQNKQEFSIERLRLLLAAALHPSFAVGRRGVGVCVVTVLPKKCPPWLCLWNITNTLRDKLLMQHVCV